MIELRRRAHWALLIGLLCVGVSLAVNVAVRQWALISVNVVSAAMLWGAWRRMRSIVDEHPLGAPLPGADDPS